MRCELNKSFPSDYCWLVAWASVQGWLLIRGRHDAKDMLVDQDVLDVQWRKSVKWGYHVTSINTKWVKNDISKRDSRKPSSKVFLNNSLVFQFLSTLDWLMSCAQWKRSGWALYRYQTRDWSPSWHQDTAAVFSGKFWNPFSTHLSRNWTPLDFWVAGLTLTAAWNLNCALSTPKSLSQWSAGVAVRQCCPGWASP